MPPTPAASETFVAVPAASIVLRDARRGTTRRVDLARFTLARTPVTRADYLGVPGGTTPSPGNGDAPVAQVSWHEAIRWCNAASLARNLTPAYDVDAATVHWDVSADGYRLPTEAEWEWAARAGSTSPAYGPLAEVAWTAADRVEGAQPVATKAPNAFGLFDMLGNVWEWCWDYIDPARYADYRSLRGGGWSDEAWSVRASVRRGSMPAARLDDVGFRPARGAVGVAGGTTAQGWSAAADRERATIDPVPAGWTPLSRC
ncbi:formylglycine-generating enzyme family protein [Pseudactinotalea sp. Z1732]|uniref:formylglycine-generating enzyme family protein n=1 Tax=Micrococcales TaxID=85006 RepID=UPI003C7BAD7F